MTQQTSDVQIQKLSLPPFDNNCYLLICPETRESIIIDAPSSPDQIVAAAQGTTVRYIIVTHRHGDHWGALADLKAATGAPVAYHPAEAEAIPVPPDVPLLDGEDLAFGRQQARVIHTPGHTPGSICLVLGGVLVSGDTLFPGGPGRSRTPADLQQIIQSLTEKLFALPDATKLLPGHGMDGVLGEEKRAYAAYAARPHPADLHGDVLWAAS
ncbi:MAG: MBL fold metallo-hydrolase [Chloroflexi bacterium]|nr:MBL fold metallo-hydrolase [Chloroflexota bacterium]